LTNIFIDSIITKYYAVVNSTHVMFRKKLR
jgi:hypothetical protein